MSLMEQSSRSKFVYMVAVQTRGETENDTHSFEP